MDSKSNFYIKELGPIYGYLPYFRSSKIRQVTTQNNDVQKLFGRDYNIKREHRDFVIIPPKSTYSFPEIEGPASISTIWNTIGGSIGHWYNFLLWAADLLIFYDKLGSLNDVWVKIYFDGEKTPSVCAPLGIFYGGNIFKEYTHYHSKYLGMTSGGYVCFFPMPFAETCQIDIINTGKKYILPFYGAVTYNELEKIDEKVGYFHAKYRHEEHPQNGEPYIIFQATGKGQYVGCNVNIQGHKRVRVPLFQPAFFFLEGDCNIYVDGEERPSMSYTGTEDYFMGGWYFTKGKFCTETHGVTLKSNKLIDFLPFGRGKIAMYRFHYPDAVAFDKSCRVDLNHGELNQVDAHYHSVAYWYQREPHDDFFDEMEVKLD
ncbi:MAG: glycoside hydrolase family 172 protein [Candidatus Helarchaeota archaeon]